MDIEDCISRLEEVFDGQPWFGPSFLSSLKKIPVTFWNQKPKGGVHSISELVVHTMDWKKFVVEKLQDNETYSIEMNSDKDWRPDVSINNQERKDEIIDQIVVLQDTICQLLEGKRDSWLYEFVLGKDYTNLYMVNGTVDHDIYHLGQINLIYSQVKNNHQ